MCVSFVFGRADGAVLFVLSIRLKSFRVFADGIFLYSLLVIDDLS